ncbi:MAG: formate dehydrogenase family accessory protein FdhD [Euryarchaeota archaeon]|nr:formate dehydrogenase family accessory protein FdhD [Euryarchaeota archaeon]RPG72212.1 MAG: formate dehydrogenase accessory sulfurtransferase FdhD [Euryarchaeota archaeon TMED192]|tara:strand:- start:179 stop:976 length:798 start_codon:yes stop_codon:yes gene_type:complete
MKGHDRHDNEKWVDVESRYLTLIEDVEFDYKAPLEEPLRISITHLGKTNELGIFMRSPGSDLNLIRGLIYNEGIISDLDSIENVTLQDDLANIALTDDSPYEPSEHNRSIMVTGSCGLCGRANLHDHQLVSSNDIFSQKQIHDMHAIAMQQQRIFKQTGGTHGAAAFNSKGNIIGCEEDVGRHNAMDKLTGYLLSESLAPSVCTLSGRISYELVQKAIRSGYCILSAVGSATTLAIQLAREYDLTLISFVRGDRMTVLSAPRRIK